MRGFIAICSLILFGGCASSDRSSAEVKLTQESDLTDDEKKRVLARIGDQVITLEEFEARLNQASPFSRVQYNSANRKRELLDSMVRFELLALEGKKKGFDKHPQVILAQKQAMVRQLTVDDLSSLVSMADVTDDMVRNFYDQNQSEFSRPLAVRASHIVFADEAQAKALLERWQRDAPTSVDDAIKRFAEEAKKNSETDSKTPPSVDLGFFGKPGVSNVARAKDAPQVPAAVATAAFALKAVGDVVATPVKTAQGWHIVQKTGYRPEFKRDFRSVKLSIRNRLFKVKKREAMERYVEKLQNQAEINIDEAVLANIKEKVQHGFRGKGMAPGFMPGGPQPKAGK